VRSITVDPRGGCATNALKVITLTPERWNQVKQLFHQALKLDERQRADFLDQACRDDETLRREVDSLLSGHQRAGSFIERPTEPITTEIIVDPITGLQPGQMISHYRIVSLLGAGGVGEVYLADDTRLKRKVAIKVLLRESLEDEERSRKRLIREARAAATLDHPNICAIHEIGEQDNRSYIAMQYVEGETLSDLIKRGPLGVKEALELAAQIADALSEAHSRGIIHRDIKPANIMITSRRRVKVLDFGLAKLHAPREAAHSDTASQSQLTDPGTIIGTVAYMSPEQLRGEPIDSRTDIFSFGVSLYEMLSGQRPFDGLNNLMLMVDIVSGEPMPLATRRPDLCPDLDRIIGKALTKRPGDRYQTVDEMKRDLTRVISAEQTTAGTLQAIPMKSPAEPVAPARLPKLSLTTIAVASLALLAVGVTGWLLLRLGAPRDVDLSSLKPVPLYHSKSEPGESFSSRPTFSRDGKMIAFSAVKGGDRNIWIKQVGAGDESEAHQITTGKWNDYSPIWSPDSQHIAFVSNRGGQTGIWSTPAPLGGGPTPLKSLEAGNPTFAPLLYWSKNGETIFYEFQRNLFALDLDTREIKQITHFEASPVPRMFSISPREDRIVYVDSKNGRRSLWTTDFKETKPLQITDSSEDADDPVWHPDGKRIIYSSNRSGTYQICFVYPDRHSTRQITFVDNDTHVCDVSADGTRILYDSTRDESDIWGAKIETGEEFEVTSETGLEIWPDASPDGRTIAYQVTRTIDQGVFSSWITSRVTSGGQQNRLAREGFEPRWSPDGARIAFLRRSPDASIDIWTIPATGGEGKRLTTTGIYFGGNAQLPCNRLVNDYAWSPDGKTIAYCSPFSGQTAVWAVSVDAAVRNKLSTDTDEEYYFSPLWSPDGMRISYLSMTRTLAPQQRPLTRLWMKDVEKDPRVIDDTDSFLRLIGWRTSTKDVLIASAEPRAAYQATSNVTLSAIPPGGGVKKAFALLESAYLFNITSSPDGKLIAFASRTDGKDNVWVIPSTGGTRRKVTANTEPLIYCSSLAWSPDGKAIYYGKQAKQYVIQMIDNFK
jgi:serine/threonine protein kinase